MLLAVLAGCTSHPENVTESDTLPAIYPDYIDVTIPTGIAPLNFSMTDDSVTTIDVTIKGKDNKTIQANGSYADFDIEEWHQLLEENKGGTLAVSVCAEKDGRWTRYRDFTIHVSQEPLGEWGITYRRIPPSYEIYSHMGLFQRDLSNFEETVPRTQWYLPELPYSQSHESRPIRVPCPRRSWCYHHPPQRQGRIPEGT